MLLVQTVLMLKLALCCCTIGTIEFTVEPKIVAAPIGGEHLKLRCNGNRTYFCIILDGSGSDKGVRTDESAVREDLRNRGITVVLPMNNISLLVVNATNENKHITAICIIALGDNSINYSSRNKTIEVILFGPPTNITLTVNGLNSLRVEWSSPIIEGVNLQFILTVTNLNSSSSQPLVISNITTQHYNFTMEGDPSSCDVNAFQVKALNDAGASGPSEIITMSLPSLLDISPVEDSLQHSLVYTENGLTLNVTFDVITGCIEYPVTSYTLVLVDSEGGKRNLSSSVTTGRSLSIEVTGLVENSLYSYYIMATNRIGDSASTSIDITTTDVEGVSLHWVKETTYSIMCSYISGSDARGCVFILVGGVEGVANITGTIDRTNFEGVLIEVPNIGCYREVLAFDLESDNTNGTLPVRGNINTSLDMCNTDSTAMDPVYIYIIVLLFFLAVVVVHIICAVIVGIYLYWKAGNSSVYNVPGRDEEPQNVDARNNNAIDQHNNQQSDDDDVNVHNNANPNMQNNVPDEVNEPIDVVVSKNIPNLSILPEKEVYSKVADKSAPDTGQVIWNARDSNSSRNLYTLPTHNHRDSTVPETMQMQTMADQSEAEEPSEGGESYQN